jgi:hypothetical protein
MTRGLAIEGLRLLHVTALALWCGWLFGYVAVVWPAVMSEADNRFPRALLAGIGVRTTGWISVAMGSAFVSLVALWAMDAPVTHQPGTLAYGVVLTALVANNVYGAIVAWPRLMLLPQRQATREWFWFRARMTVSLVLGLGLYGAALITS